MNEIPKSLEARIGAVPLKITKISEDYIHTTANVADRKTVTGFIYLSHDGQDIWDSREPITLHHGDGLYIPRYVDVYDEGDYLERKIDLAIPPHDGGVEILPY